MKRVRFSLPCDGASQNRKRRRALLPPAFSALALFVGLHFFFFENDPSSEQQRILRSATNAMADRRRSLMNHFQSHRGLRMLHEKLSMDDRALVWLVNQPKCGTGTFERTLEHYLGCELKEDIQDKATRVMECVVDGQQHLIDEERITPTTPRGAKKTYFRTHFFELAEEVKAEYDAEMEAAGEKPEKCVAITAVRNPLQSIPSIFFEYRKEREGFCDGSLSKEELLDQYETYLHGNDPEPYAYPPQWQAATTAKMLRAFGATDILAAMEELRDKGFAYFANPDPNGVWAGCELLFLQVDHDKQSANLDEGMKTLYPGLDLQKQGNRDELCPNSKENYHALMNYEISDDLVNQWSVENPEIHDVIAYYRNTQLPNYSVVKTTEVVNQLWLVNQPKCGTGSLEAVFEEHMGCHNTDVHDKTKFYECLGNYKKLYRTHYADVATEQKVLVDSKFKSTGVHTDRCMVITAVRNPLLSIPSRFFETNLQNDYCSGTQSVEEVLGAYQQYLRYSFEPANQVATTAMMLRAFGAPDIRQAMERLVDHGYAFFDDADVDGAWGGCNLLLLQIDFAEDNSNINEALQHVHEGAYMHPTQTRSEQCPKAVKNIEAITNYNIDDHTIDVMAKTNPEIRDVIQYYRDHFTSPMAVSSQ